MFGSFGRLLGGVLFATSMLASQAHAADKVQFNLAWLPQGSTGGVLIAIANGYYKEVDLEVNAVRGYGGQRTVNEVDQGLFEFGYGDPASVILNRAQGGTSVMIGAINTRYPGGLCYINTGKTFTKLTDIKGMTVGGGAASPVQNVVPPWLQANGLPPNYIKLLRLDPAVINTALLEGRVDLAECWEGASKAVLDTMFANEKKKLGMLLYRDFNMDVYGNGIVTSEKIAKTKPDMVKRFLRATYKGYAYMKENPAKAAEQIAATNKLLDKKILEQQIVETNRLITEGTVEQSKMGLMRPDRMRHTVEFVKQAYPVAATVQLDAVYTNQFIE